MGNFAMDMFHALDLRVVFVLLMSLMIIEPIAGPGIPIHTLRRGVYALGICIVVSKISQVLFGASSPGTQTGAGRTIDPVRQKHTELGRSETLEWVASEMQGWRPAMEDAVRVVAELPQPLERLSLLGVFDGHSGKRVSAIVAEQFPSVLASCAQGLLDTGGRVVGDLATNAGVEEETSSANDPDDNTEVSPALLEKALHLAMMTMDQLLRQCGAEVLREVGSAASNARPPGMDPDRPRNAFDLMGSTAIVVLVDHGDGAASGSRPKRLIVANCGDSRAILCRKGEALEMSEDHKPENPEEEARIEKAGGHVAKVHPSPCARVDGWGLNLSRALGDFHYKARSDLPPHAQKVIAVPDVRTLELCDEDQFLLLGCDGIFELHTSPDAIHVVRNSLQGGATLRKAVEELLDASCSPNPIKTQGKGTDNCSSILVRFLT